MINIKLTKVIVSSLVVASVLSLNPTGVRASWKQDNIGWWYTEGSSNSIGWKLIDGNWYYFYSDGYMAKDTTIDGYNLNADGAWISNASISKGEMELDYLGQQILENISIQKPSFHIKCEGNMDKVGNAVKDAIDKLKYTNSSEFYNINNYAIETSSSSSSTIVDIKIDCVYKMTAEMATDLDNKARSIVASITSDSMSLADKERVIHDWIVNNTQYDESYSIYDPYNTLIKHTGVCEGYTLLAQKMFTIAGIESLIVEGSASNSAGSGSHAWNMVHIDDKWHHVDLTWDDPTSSEDILSYDYYNLSDKEMSADHTWDTTKYPSAN